MAETKSKHPKQATPKRMRPEVGELDLDPYNPRLAAHEEGRSQPELLRLMVAKFKLEELAESIVSAGYRPFDPLIGAREKNRIVVLEGNRRVAAIKLLLNPDLGPEKMRPRWRALAVRLSSDA